jgi:hypothetical protein
MKCSFGDGNAKILYTGFIAKSRFGHPVSRTLAHPSAARFARDLSRTPPIIPAFSG